MLSFSVFMDVDRRYLFDIIPNTLILQVSIETNGLAL